MKLEDLRNFHVLRLLHSILSTKVPKYLSDKFSFISNISTRVTRGGSHLLSIPIHRTTIYNKSFIVSASRLWNSLPAHLKNDGRRARFGALVKDLLLAGGLAWWSVALVWWVIGWYVWMSRAKWTGTIIKIVFLLFVCSFLAFMYINSNIVHFGNFVFVLNYVRG